MSWLVEGDTPQLPTFTSNLYYIHNDHLGTPQVITDNAQNIVWGADYESFGEVSVNTITKI
ncbi:MAG: RHS domain-containing protein [Porticoccus sp.]